MSGVGITYLWSTKEFPSSIRLEGKRGDYEVYTPERTCYDVNASAREHGAHLFLWRCSNCDESYDTEMESMNYCPNCGARVIKSDQDL